MENEKIREMIGQRFILGLDSKTTDIEIKLLIEKYHIGGFIIYKNNYTNYKSMIDYIKKLKYYNRKNKAPLFIAIDQEGGRVNRLPSEIVNTSRAFNLANTNNIEIITKSAKYTSEILKNSGINMDFAPVLDIKRYSESHAIGDRSFGENYKDVIKYGIPYLNELSKDIIAVPKHFPGHGIVKKDSHYSLPIVDSYNDFNHDIKPFEEAIKNDCDAMMIGHILIKDINPKIPIGFDKLFIENIRKKYNYDGLLITDEIKMNAIKLHYNITKLIKNAFDSHLDIILMKYKHNDIRKFNKLYNFYMNNICDINYLTDSYNRIIKIKAKYNLTDNTDYKLVDIKKYNEKLKDFRSTYE